MAHREPRRRVAVVVTRTTSHGPELLVFDHRDFPEAGTQVPGGGVEPGESVDEAAVREVREETGVADVEVGRRIGVNHWPTADGRPQHTVVVHATTVQTLDAWQHVVTGQGGDDGLVLACRFVDLGDELLAEVAPGARLNLPRSGHPVGIVTDPEEYRACTPCPAP